MDEVEARGMTEGERERERGRREAIEGVCVCVLVVRMSEVTLAAVLGVCYS